MKEHIRNWYTKDVTKCIIELIGQAEVSGKNCRKVIDIVVRHIFHTTKDTKDHQRLHLLGMLTKGMSWSNDR